MPSFADVYAFVAFMALLTAFVSGMKYGGKAENVITKKIFKVSGAFFVVMLAADMAFDIVPHAEKNEPPPKIEEPAPSKPAPPKVHYNGRGFDGRSEPNYVGLNGFVAVWYDEQDDLATHLKYTYTPWQVPTYTRDKQFWSKSDETINHKEPIVVREQFLVHEGYDNYSGYLKVERSSDGRQFFINVRNFVVEPYWLKKDLVEALKGGCVIVTYHQRSNFYPVSGGNKKAEVPDGLNLLATGLTGIRGKGFVDGSTNQIAVSLSPEVRIFFNKDDLTLSY